MESPTNKAIELKRTRDFSQKFNAAFEFLKQEFKPMGNALLRIAGPFVIIAAVLGAYYQKNTLSLLSFTFEDPEQFFNDDFILTAVGLVISSLIAYVLVLAVILEYSRLYSEGGNRSVQPEAVWDSVKPKLFGYFGSAIGYTILFMAVLFIGAVIIGVSFAAELLLLGFLVVMAFIPFVLLAASWNYIAIISYNMEGNGFIDNINRSLNLLRNNWWKTAGLFFVAYILISVVSMVFAIPTSVMAMSTAMHSIDNPDAVPPSRGKEIIFAVTAFVASAGSYFVNIVFTLLVLMQYYNLVEQRDAAGLIERIEGIGDESKDDEGEDF